MDYFECYGLPVSFHPDIPLVKKKFYELSKKYHPDFFIGQDKEKQDEILVLSTLNNRAYEVLSDPQKRMQYVLELKGVLVEGEAYALPQDFLMEMMEVNEVLMDLQLEPDRDKLRTVENEVAEIERNLEIELDRATAAFDAPDEAFQGDYLEVIRDLYYRKKYLSRINVSIFKLESEL